jgi:hypothetical protein
MRRVLAPLAALAAALSLAVPARAGVVYSNFGTGQTAYSQGYYGFNGGGDGSGNLSPGDYGFAVAESFTPTGNYRFSSVELALAYLFGTNAFTVSLMSDAGGHPGTVLESFSVSSNSRTEV